MKLRAILAKVILVLVIAGSLYPIYQTRVVSRKGQEEKIEDFYANFEVPKEETDSSYFNLAKAELETIGVLYMPTIDLRIPIFRGTSEQALVEGCGLVEGTGDLSGELGENPVVISHNGRADKNLLINLEEVEIGDSYYIHNGQEIQQYDVIDINVVSPINEYDHLLASKDSNLSTVRTCTPTGVNSHRLLVTGERVPFDGELEEASLVLSNFEKILVGFALLALLILILTSIRDVRNYVKEKSSKG